LGGARLIQEGQLIHESVFKRMAESEDEYLPKAVFSNGSSWRSLALLMPDHLVERDPYASAELVLSNLKNPETSKLTDGDFNVLSTLVASGKFIIYKFGNAFF
jgi:hypothetical protein